MGARLEMGSGVVAAEMGSLSVQDLMSRVDEDGVTLFDEDSYLQLDDSIGSPAVAALKLEMAAATMLARAAQLRRPVPDPAYPAVGHVPPHWT